MCEECVRVYFVYKYIDISIETYRHTHTHTICVNIYYIYIHVGRRQRGCRGRGEGGSGCGGGRLDVHLGALLPAHRLRGNRHNDLLFLFQGHPGGVWAASGGLHIYIYILY